MQCNLIGSTKLAPFHKQTVHISGQLSLGIGMRHSAAFNQHQFRIPQFSLCTILCHKNTARTMKILYYAELFVGGIVNKNLFCVVSRCLIHVKLQTHYKPSYTNCLLLHFFHTFDETSMPLYLHPLWIQRLEEPWSVKLAINTCSLCCFLQRLFQKLVSGHEHISPTLHLDTAS